MNHAAWSSWLLGGTGGKGGGGTGAGAKGKTSGYSDADPIPAENGADGLGGGGGGGTCYENADPELYPAGKGGNGVVIIRLSGFVVKNIPVPTPLGPYVYDGNAHTGVVEFFAYTLTGTPVATNADVYAVTATIEDGKPYTWADADQPGKSKWGPRTVTWTIRQLEVEVPQGADLSYVYDAKQHSPVDFTRFTVTDGLCYTTNGLMYARLTDYIKTDADKYSLKAQLNKDDGLTNFVWKLGALRSMDDQSYGWEITQAPNAIVDFYYPGYPLKNLKNHHPKNNFTSAWGRETTVAEYRPLGSEGDWTDWGESGPSAKGNYEVRVTIPECPNWQGDSKTLSFGTWEKWSDIFADRATVTISGYGANTGTLTDFPASVRIKEPVSEGYSPMTGFEYARAGRTGQDICFFDSNGDPIEHDVDIWDTRGESLVWVRIPTLKLSTSSTAVGATITMAWKPAGDIRRPGYAPERVWNKTYSGVWHMSTWDDGMIRDATGNGNHAALQDGATGEFVDSLSGKALSLKGSDGCLVAANVQTNTEGNLSMTYSAWYKYPDFVADNKVSGGNKMFAGLKYGASTTAEMQSWSGWGLRMNNDFDRYAWLTTGQAWVQNDPAGFDIRNYWTYFGYVTGYQAATASAGPGVKKVYAYDKQPYVYNQTVNFTPTTDKNYYVKGTDRPLLMLAAGGFEVDEARLALKALDNNWTEQVYRSLYNANYSAFGLVLREEQVCDYWTTVPAKGWKTVWYGTPTDPSKGQYKDAGANVSVTYLNLSNHVVLAAKPSEYGSYRAIFDHANASSPTYALPYRAQRYSVDFYIVEPADPIHDIGGNGGDSGRILLMNADTHPGASVTNQGWCARDEKGVTYWKCLSDLEGTNNILRGVEFELVRSSDTNTLWTLTECRQGNTFPTNNAATLSANEVYLPRSASTALAATNENVRADRRGDAGWLMMRNTTRARVTSACFSNGVGTVYFDAVNAVKGATENFTLVLEVAHVDPETAENPWLPVELAASHVVNGAITADQAPANALALKETTGGREDNFYRVHARVNSHRPTWLRLRRTTINAAQADRLDANFILLDNLIVSVPPVSATLAPYGRFDPTLEHDRAVGCGGALSVPFPMRTDTNLTGRCRVTLPPNSGHEGEKPDQYLALAQMFYRWRYLGQFRDPDPTSGEEWKVKTLKGSETGHLTTEGTLETPVGMGDIEFYFLSIMKSPYYDYVNYSSVNVGVSKAGYTENSPLSTNRLDFAAVTAETGVTALPSGGRDWFVRVRESASPYEGMRLLTQAGDGNGPVTTNDFELITKGAWCARLRTAAALDVGLRFRLEGVNPQTAGSEEYAISTDRWCPTASVDGFPATVRVEPCDEKGWCALPCDAKTGWLLFQFDEGKKSLVISHSEFMDFNSWSAAVDTNGLFVGSQTSTNYYSTATGETNIDWSAWSLSVATNSDWREDLGVSSGERADVAYPKNQPFSQALTRHRWVAENAMWTYGKWTHETWGKDAKGTAVITTVGDDSAVQLEGCGKGRLSFVSTVSTPKGLDTIRSTMRLAQINRFTDFCLYNKMEIDWEEHKVVFAQDLANYTVATFVNVSEWGGTDYSGDGTVSLVGYYDDEKGAYEARFSRGSKDTNVRIRLIRWYNDGQQIRSKELGYAEVDDLFQRLYTSNGDFSKSGALVLSIEECAKGTGGAAAPFTLVQAGFLTEAQAATGLNVSVLDKKQFAVLSFRDEATDRLTKGTYGVLSANCLASFMKPAYYDQGLGWGASSQPAKNALKLKVGATVNFLGHRKGEPDGEYKIGDEYYDNCWIVRPGRMLKNMNTTAGYWGFDANGAISGKIEMLIAEHGTSAWVPVATNTVTSFADQKFENVVHSPLDCDVKLSVMGTTEDTRTDIVVNDVELSQWRGQETSNLEKNYGHKTEFVYTEGWIDRRYAVGDGLVLSLQPARAKNASSPVSLRGPLLRGVGLFSFSWRNADPNCVLKLQMLTGTYASLEASLLGRTREAPDSASWQTIETYDFSELDAAGEKTAYVNLRAPQAGVLRLVVDKKTVERALAGPESKANAFYGGLQITDAFVTDMPAYDNRCWSAWNMRAGGWWDGTPDDWANYADGTHGYAALLNNTLDPETLADHDKDYYRQNPPYVQSPAFGTNCVGEVIVKARLYDKDANLATENPAVITFYGARSIDPVTKEPTGWVDTGTFLVISNATYATYRVKLSASENYQAVRLAVKGVEGVVTKAGETPPPYAPPARVAFDTLYLLEQAPPVIRFRNLHVRPFRDASLMKSTAVVPEWKIVSPDEQPLLSEAFGFQAELEIQSSEEEQILTDDPEHPITVELWYYHGEDVWGFDNWRSNATGHATLATADGTNLIFRSTMGGASVVPPIFKETGNDYEMLQYHLIARYYVKGDSKAKEHPLSEKEWTVPSWYDGFADPNKATGAKFAAYTVLDTLSPGRAWINEINTTESSKQKSDETQFVELAVPLGVDMTGWEVYLYSFDSATGTGARRYEGEGPFFKLGTYSCQTVKKDTSDAPMTHYGFLTVGAPNAKGVVTDGRWTSASGKAITGGTLDWTKPFGFELRRPSGIIEHRAVSEGYSEAYSEYWYGYQYSGTNLVKVLSEKVGGTWTFAGKDPKEDGKGLSVTNGQGKAETDWAVKPLTLGLLNEGQYIDPNWYLTPNGDYVWVYLTCLSPQIRQIVGGATNQSDVVTVQAGGATNITYEVDNFYQLADLKVASEHALSKLTGPVRRNGKNYYDLYLYDISNRVDVSVSADISDDLKRRGVTPDNPYSRAIMRWLNEGVTRDADGNEIPFAGDEIHDFVYRYQDGTTTNLTMKEAYWLDVDVTQAGWELRGNMGDTGGGALGPVMGEMKRQKPGESLIHTNRFGTLWVQLTNSVSGVVHAPWRLQGLNNERSDDRSTYASTVWTSVTFKVAGRLQNGLVNNDKRPLRYFTFDKNSFRPANDALAPYSARVEFVDPFSRQSPAYDWNWGPWWQCPVFVAWVLDDQLSTAGVEVMKYDDIYDDSVYGPVIGVEPVQ